MALVCAQRTIQADPTSVALLLADPATVEFWPAAERADLDPHALHGATLVRVGELTGALRMLAPSRTPRAFVLRFDFDADGSPTDQDCVHVEGRIELAAAAAASDRGPCTDASLELRAPEHLAADAEAFLSRVAEAAERRARAA